jgi:hypothetical protein|tara:strand:- start:846 stop:1751 length:906 start_codon:yes stop_codon:yes gene_type:complete
MKNLFYKIFNPDKYLKQKQSKIIELDTKIFREKYEKYINSIQVVLENKNEISFLHSGHIGDIINVLPVIKEISKTHACNLLIELNLPIPVNYNNHPAGKFYLDKRIYNMLYPLLKKQSYIKNVDIFNNQSIDINFNLIRELPINLLFDNNRYGFHIAGVQLDLSKKYIEVDDVSDKDNKITICRSLRYQNNLISYSFLEKFENVYYIGVLEEYEQLKKEIKNLKFYECKDFLEMAMIIKNSKVHIGNSTLGIDIAEGLKSPRLLEASPYFPARQVHGEKGYDFYFQAHFEKYFNILYNLKN